MGLQRRYKRRNKHVFLKRVLSEKMELELRFDEVMGAYHALGRLMDRRFLAVETSVRVSDAFRRISPVFEDLAGRHDALLEEHAKRDEEGKILYKDEGKTRIDLADTADDALNAFFASTIPLTLPQLRADGLALSKGFIQLGDVAPIAFLFDGEWDRGVRDLSRGEALGLLGGFDGLLGESFAESCSLVKIAAARHALLVAARDIYEGRRQLIAELATRDEGGGIVYSDPENKIVAESEELRAGLERFMGETVSLSLPVLKLEDFAQPEGGALSPRQMYGLLPVLEVV